MNQDEFYILDDMNIIDRCTVNGRISKKLCEKIILPKIERTEKELNEAVELLGEMGKYLGYNYATGIESNSQFHKEIDFFLAKVKRG
jgi:hypothetical protein